MIVLLLLPESQGLLPALEERIPRRAARRSGSAPPVQLASRGEPLSLRAEGLTKRYGAVAALDGLDLLLEPGTVHALVGPNGSGKTTALRALAGTLAPDEGRVLLGDADVTSEPVERRVELGIARTLQATAVFGPLTALESVLVGVAGRRRFGDLGRTLLATPRHRVESEAARAAGLEALEAVGLGARADERADLLTATEQRLLMIATAVATAPRVLLLDEPAAGIGPAELPRLAAAVASLRDRGLGLLVVEHNLRLVRTIADRVTVLDAGRAIAAGLPDEVGSDPAVRAAYLGRHSI